MLRRKAMIAALGATLAAGAAAFAPAAHAGGHVGVNLSFVGPGYAVSVGNAPYYHGHRHYGHRYYGPRYRYYAPAPVYVAPPVVVPAPVYAPAPVPYYYPRGRVYYRY
jgi:hypothetical protein